MSVATAPRTLAGLTRPRWLGAVTSGLPGRLGLVMVGSMLGLVAVGPFIAPHSPTALVSAPFAPPSSAHLLGTDQLGRDVLSRVLHGGQSVVMLPVLAVALAFAIGGVLGLVAGYRGGIVDAVVTRLCDVLLSIPPLLLVIVLVISLGSSNEVLIVVTGLFFAPRVIRIVRGATFSVCEKEYIVAARARGERTTSIVFREILPNITGTVLVEFALRLSYAITFIATLAFLGLGEQPPSSAWGLMVADGRAFITHSPLIAVVPAAAIAALTIGVNLISDQAASILARDVER